MHGGIEYKCIVPRKLRSQVIVVDVVLSFLETSVQWKDILLETIRSLRTS